MATRPLLKGGGVEALRGFYYQLLWTVIRWTQLRPNELLVIEGEEDVDVVSPDGDRTIEQIKYRASKPLSTDDVVAVVDRLLLAFWNGRAAGCRVTMIVRASGLASRSRNALMRQWLSGGVLSDSQQISLLNSIRRTLIYGDAAAGQLIGDVEARRMFFSNITFAWLSGEMMDAERAAADALGQFATPTRDAPSLLRTTVSSILARIADANLQRRTVRRVDLHAMLNDDVLGARAAIDQSGGTDGYALGIAEDSDLCAVALVRAPNVEELESRWSRAAEAMRLVGSVRTVAAQDISSLDTIAYVVVARRTRRWLERCWRTLRRQTHNKWLILDLQLPSVDALRHKKIAEIADRLPPGAPRALRTSVHGDNDSVIVDAARVIAADVLARTRGEVPPNSTVSSALRWVYLIDEGEYWTVNNNRDFRRTPP